MWLQLFPKLAFQLFIFKLFVFTYMHPKRNWFVMLIPLFVVCVCVRVCVFFVWGGVVSPSLIDSDRADDRRLNHYHAGRRIEEPPVVGAK